jgi:drug/metabolite transporter (DMT)-like permease
VLLVLCRADWHRLVTLRLVPGDIYMIFAAIAWSFYSWLLAFPAATGEIRRSWATFLLAQITFGVLWSGVFTASEWAITGARIVWSWQVAAALLFVATGPAVIAYRCWGAGVQRAGPNIAAFFSNLTPLFAAVMSSAFLGEWPHIYHVIAFMLIVGGIVLSSRR